MEQEDFETECETAGKENMEENMEVEPEKEKGTVVNGDEEEDIHEIPEIVEEDDQEAGEKDESMEGEILTQPEVKKVNSCDECTFTATSQYAIKRHKKVAHKKTSYKCKFCEKEWPTSAQCNGHMKSCKKKAETDSSSEPVHVPAAESVQVPAMEPDPEQGIYLKITICLYSV